MPKKEEYQINKKYKKNVWMNVYVTGTKWQTCCPAWSDNIQQKKKENNNNGNKMEKENEENRKQKIGGIVR